MVLHSYFLSSAQWCSSIGIQFTVVGFLLSSRFPLFFSHPLSFDSCFLMYFPEFIHLVRVEFSSVVLFSAFRISALLTTFCWRNHLMFHGFGCVMLLQFVICDYSLWFVVLFLFRDPAGFFLFFLGSTFWLGLSAWPSFLLFLISGFMMWMFRNVVCVWLPSTRHDRIAFVRVIWPFSWFLSSYGFPSLHSFSYS